MNVAFSGVKPRARIVLLLPTETYRADAFFDAAAALNAEVVVATELLGLVDNPPDAVAADVGLPCVVKPVSLAASTGVIRADTPSDAVLVAERVRKILAHPDRPSDEPLLVEHFVAGAEVSLGGLLRDGELEVLALFDKPDPLDGPYFEETIYVTPSRLSAVQQNSVVAIAAARCRALGLREGPVRAEVRVGPGATDATPAVWLLEVAARSIGGLCSRVLCFGAGISLEEVILRHALGLDTGRLTRSGGAAGMMMVPVPRSGRGNRRG